MKYKINGMPLAGQELYMENYGTLLTMPWFQYVELEEAKRTCPYYRYLLDNAPIVGDKKRILVTAQLQYLTPDSSSIQYDDNWHVDGNITGEFEDRMHLLVSPCSALTKFNSEPLTLDVDGTSYQAINQAVVDNYSHLDEFARSVEPNRFYTFDKSHAHRAVHPRAPEFRFMMRIIETDWYQGEKYYTHEALVYSTNKDGKVFPTWSMRRDKDGIQINPHQIKVRKSLLHI
jgi:hypothetical protein